MTALNGTHDAIRDLQERHTTLAHQFANDSAQIHQTLTSVARDIGVQAARVTELSVQVTALGRRVDRFDQAGWWDRLIWLLFNRIS